MCEEEYVLVSINEENKYVFVEKQTFALKSKEAMNAHANFKNLKSKNKDLPEYELIKTTGAAHNRTFTIKVTYHGEELAQASGKTKKQAQQEAAFIACQKLGIINTEGTLNE